MMKENFIKKAIDREKRLHHIGMTHKILGIQEKFNLSHAETLLEGIVNTDIGDTFTNPLVVGRHKYKVTKALKSHANFALNLIRISEGKYKKKK
jgi:hypothetical protein